MAEVIKEAQGGSQSSSGTQKRTKIDLDDLSSPDSQYLDFKVGEQVQMVVNEIEKVEGTEYSLSSVDYKFELIDEEGDRLSVTAWGLWRKLQQAYQEAQDEGLQGISGLHLRLAHPGREDYRVEWSLDGSNWNEVVEE